MFKFCITGFVLNLLLLSTTSSENATKSAATDLQIQEAFQFSNVITTAIKEYIRDALPIEAKPEGEQILKTVQEGLEYCEKLVNIPEDIWQYKYCGSSLLRDGMAALAALQSKYRPYSSSASRMKLFW